jgi:8-oxo-dGTP pyrophosphatase MutT (NUDIX family)
MSIPAADVRLLRTMFAGLQRDKLKFYKPHANRAASALVLRFGGQDGVKVARSFSAADRNLSVDEVLQRLELHATHDAPSSLQLLFLKKRGVQAHRWSGAIAFPGGKRDPLADRDDFDTVATWTKENIGMPLTSDFVVLGRLPDYYVYSRQQGAGLMTARFVLLHIAELTPSVKVADHEVEAVRWVPLGALDASNVVRDAERHSLRSYVQDDEAQYLLRIFFRNVHLYFPAIALPDGMGRLWGLTLTSTSTLMALAGRERLDWPLFSSHSPVVRWLFVKPVHGYYELTGSESGGRRYRVDHVGSLLFIVAVAVLYFYGMLIFVVEFWQALSLALSHWGAKKAEEYTPDEAQEGWVRPLQPAAPTRRRARDELNVKPRVVPYVEAAADDDDDWIAAQRAGR